MSRRDIPTDIEEKDLAAAKRKAALDSGLPPPIEIKDQLVTVTSPSPTLDSDGIDPFEIKKEVKFNLSHPNPQEISRSRTDSNSSLDEKDDEPDSKKTSSSSAAPILKKTNLPDDKETDPGLDDDDDSDNKQFDSKHSFSREDAEYQRAVDAHASSMTRGLTREHEKKAKEAANAKAVKKTQHGWRHKFVGQQKADEENYRNYVNKNKLVSQALKEAKFFGGTNGRPLIDTAGEQKARLVITDITSNDKEQSKILDRRSKRANNYRKIWEATSSGLEHKRIQEEIEQKIESASKKISTIEKLLKEKKYKGSGDLKNYLKKLKTEKQSLEAEQQKTLKGTIKLEEAIARELYPTYEDASGKMHTMAPKAKDKPEAALYLDEKNKASVIIFHNTEDDVAIVQRENHHYLYHKLAEVTHTSEDGHTLSTTPEKVTEQIIARGIYASKSEVFYQERSSDNPDEFSIQRWAWYPPKKNGNYDLEHGKANLHQELVFIQFEDKSEKPEDQNKALERYKDQCELLTKSQNSHYKFVLSAGDKYFLFQNNGKTEFTKTQVDQQPLPQDTEAKSLAACLSNKNKSQLQAAGLIKEQKADKTRLTTKETTLSKQPNDHALKLLAKLQQLGAITPGLSQEPDQQFVRIAAENGQKNTIQFKVDKLGKDSPKENPQVGRIIRHANLTELNTSSATNDPEKIEKERQKQEEWLEKDFGKDFRSSQTIAAAEYDFDILEIEATKEYQSKIIHDPVDRIRIYSHYDKDKKLDGSILYRKIHQQNDELTNLKRKVTALTGSNTPYRLEKKDNKNTYSLPSNQTAASLKLAAKGNPPDLVITQYEQQENKEGVTLWERFIATYPNGRKVDYFLVNPAIEEAIKESRKGQLTPQTGNPKFLSFTPTPSNQQPRLLNYKVEKNDKDEIIKRTWKIKDSEGFEFTLSDNGPGKTNSIEKQLKDPRSSAEMREQCWNYRESETLTRYAIAPRDLAAKILNDRKPDSSPKTDAQSLILLSAPEEKRLFTRGSLEFKQVDSKTGETVQIRKEGQPSPTGFELAVNEMRVLSPNTYEVEDNSLDIKNITLKRTVITKDAEGNSFVSTAYDPTFKSFLDQSIQLSSSETPNVEYDWKGVQKSTWKKGNFQYTETYDEYGDIYRQWTGVNGDKQTVTITSKSPIQKLNDFTKSPDVPAPATDKKNSSTTPAKQKQYQMAKRDILAENHRASDLFLADNKKQLSNAVKICNGLTDFLQVSESFDRKKEDSNNYTKFSHLDATDDNSQTTHFEKRKSALALLGFEIKDQDPPINPAKEPEKFAKLLDKSYADGIASLKQDVSALRYRIRQAEKVRSENRDNPIRYQQEVREINEQAKQLFERIHKTDFDKAITLSRFTGRTFDPSVTAQRPLVVRYDKENEAYTVLDKNGQVFVYTKQDLDNINQLRNNEFQHEESEKHTKTAYERMSHQAAYDKATLQQRLTNAGVTVVSNQKLYADGADKVSMLQDSVMDIFSGRTRQRCLIKGSDGSSNHEMELVIQKGKLALHLQAYDDQGKVKQLDSATVATMISVAMKVRNDPSKPVTISWDSNSLFGSRPMPSNLPSTVLSAVKQFEQDQKQQYIKEGKPETWATHKAAMDAMMVDHSSLTAQREVSLAARMIQFFESGQSSDQFSFEKESPEDFAKAHHLFEDYLRHHFKLKAITELQEQLTSQMAWKGGDEKAIDDEIKGALQKLEEKPHELLISESSNKLDGWKQDKPVSQWLQEQVEKHASRFHQHKTIPIRFEPDTDKNGNVLNWNKGKVVVQLRTYASDNGDSREKEQAKILAENFCRELKAQNITVDSIEVKGQYEPDSESTFQRFKTRLTPQSWRQQPKETAKDGEKRAEKNAEALQAQLNQHSPTQLQGNELMDLARTEAATSRFGYGS